jgi:60 kDa SS-A/Ro ribonucleoprotein
MSKLFSEIKVKQEILKKNPVINFMGGISYQLNPVDTLKMITSSSIFGEPQYYRKGKFTDGFNEVDKLVKEYSIFSFDNKKTSDIMEEAIDSALSYDFKTTIEWALELRKNYYMRLNPQVIMVRAAVHPNRIEFSKKNPELFRKINKEVMSRADEPATQLTYYLYKNSNKNGIPSILKRSWTDRINSMSRYEISKYKSSEIGLINTIRVCHAKGKLIDELMQNGTIEVNDKINTWERLKSQGKKWKEILSIINIPHMALLRNLRGIFTEVNDIEFCKNIIEQLKNGVEKGKQFPFRYFTAMKFIEQSDVNHKPLILDGLEECIDISRSNMPTLSGKTMCLSDNSGSAWGAFNSEYGSVTVAEIDNLSSVLTAQNSDEGYVGKFGDSLKVFPISKRNGALNQTKEITNNRNSDVGGSTENGIWVFFEKAINNNEYWDNIFIYSDQQAGHGGLYGIGSDYVDMDGESYFVQKSSYSAYINVMKLINKYRTKVNPKVNIFSIQTAGYDNVIIPEYIYRGAVLYGWTGKETIFAKSIIDFWNEKDNTKTEKSSS